MKGAITSKEERTEGSVLLFDVNENNYRPEGTRPVTRNQAIDGSMLTTDWGYVQSNRRISLDNLYLSKAVYEGLIVMKEDNSNVFHFHYKNTTWHVVIERAEGVPVGNKVNVSVLLTVVEKVADGETA